MNMCGSCDTENDKRERKKKDGKDKNKIEQKKKRKTVSQESKNRCDVGDCYPFFP